MQRQRQIGTRFPRRDRRVKPLHPSGRRTTRQPAEHPHHPIRHRRAHLLTRRRRRRQRPPRRRSQHRRLRRPTRVRRPTTPQRNRNPRPNQDHSEPHDRRNKKRTTRCRPLLPRQRRARAASGLCTPVAGRRWHGRRSRGTRFWLTRVTFFLREGRRFYTRARYMRFLRPCLLVASRRWRRSRSRRFWLTRVTFLFREGRRLYTRGWYMRRLRSCTLLLGTERVCRVRRGTKLRMHELHRHVFTRKRLERRRPKPVGFARPRLLNCLRLSERSREDGSAGGDGHVRARQPTSPPYRGGTVRDGDAELLGALVTIRRRSRNRSIGDDRELCGHRMRYLEQRRRHLVHMPIEGGRGVRVRRERKPTGEQLVQDRARLVDVRRRGKRAPARLLGRDVCRRAQHLARACRQGCPTTNDFCDPQISDLQRALARKHQVLRLDVTMQDTVLVRVVQPGTKCEKNCARHVGRETTGVKAAPHRAARQPLHHEQTQAVVVDEVIYGDDVRMVERREHPRFGDEPRAHPRIRGECVRQLLDRDHSSELTMTSRKNDAIGASTQLAADLVRGKGSYDPLVVDHGGSITLPLAEVPSDVG